MAHLCLPAKICSCDANLQVAHNSPALAAYPGTAARPPVLNTDGHRSKSVTAHPRLAELQVNPPVSKLSPR